MDFVKNFSIQEFVDPITYTDFGEKSWQIFDDRIILSIQKLRDYFDKPITINNWFSGGQFKFRGFRPPSCTIGAIVSAHRFGRAIDFDVAGMKAEEVRQVIIQKHEELFPLIMRMEAGVNWVHIDTVWTGKREIVLFHA